MKILPEVPLLSLSTSFTGSAGLITDNAPKECPYKRAGELSISQSASRTTTSRLIATPEDKLALPGWLKLPIKRKASRRRFLKVSIIAGNVLLFAGVAFLVLHPSQGGATAPATKVDNAAASAQLSTLDQLASASIADSAAKMAGLDEEVFVSLQAQAEQLAQDHAAVTDSDVATKPQVIETAFKSNKDIKVYVVQAGDTISKIADKFGVTSDSIRWSNNLTGNSVKAGTKLKIPPVNGIVYTVKKGDTATSLATKYNISKEKVIQYNDAELHGLSIGELIILPDASKAAQVARTSTSNWVGGSLTPVYGYNGYDYGYCTYWVAYLRQKAGNPVPVGMHDASDWPYMAQRFGLPTGHTPRVGAAVVTSTAGEGHVAYVIAVNGPRTVTVSEMNHLGWGRTDVRTLTGDFFYIY